MSNSDLHEALERLAGVADHDPMPDLIPGIRAEARRHRNRTVALAATGVAAAAVLGYAVLAGGQNAQRGDDTQVVDPPTASATPSEPSPPALEPLDTGRADVDGDGRADAVSLLVPPGTNADDPAEETWLQVRTSSTTRTVPLTDSPTYVGFLDPGLADLDGDGDAEVLLLASGGGENGVVTVWTWSEGDLVRAQVVDDARAQLAAADGLSTGSEELGVVFQDDRLMSWKIVKGGGRVVVWRWNLDATTLSPLKLPGTQCVSLGVIGPC